MIPVETVQAALGPAALGGGEAGELSQAIGRPPRAAVRLRPGVSPAELPFATTPVPWHGGGFFVEPNVRPGAQLNFAAADYYIQDAASLLAVALLDAQPGELICDLCAAPGGKATAILEALHARGWLLANEAVRSRLPPLTLNLARHGATRYVVSQLDPARLADFLGPTFDAVLVDAPCSGQSLLARGKQSAAAFTPAAIEHCAARQARILDAAVRLVRPGGRLVYATCTFSYAENEAQIERLLQRHHDWTSAAHHGWSAWQAGTLPGCYRLWPHRHGCGGAFAALLRRQGSAVEPAAVAGAAPKTRLPEQALPTEFATWGRLQAGLVLGNPQQRFAWPQRPVAPLSDIAAAGPEVAFRKGATWHPAYALAMRRDGPNWCPAATRTMDDDDARAYVAGQALRGAARGWQVAVWRGRPLGWLKGDGRTLKNHLPKPARFECAERR